MTRSMNWIMSREIIGIYNTGCVEWRVYNVMMMVTYEGWFQVDRNGARV